MIRRGARRFDSRGILPGVDHVAFENPDGQRVLVVTNSGAARSVVLRLGEMKADVALDNNSVTTLVWS